MKRIFKLFPLFLLTLLSSCGGSGGGGGGAATGGNTPRTPAHNEEARVNQVTEGKYRAFIRPMNYQVFGRVNSGMATVTIDESLRADVYMDDVPQVAHMQAIFTGTRCPVGSDDINKDGYIDIKEAAAGAGKVLLPLDGDISSQEASKNVWTQVSNFAYTYTRLAPLETVMTDLHANDSDPKDHVSKLNKREELNLEGRVVMVLGAPLSAKLPATVESLEGSTSYASIPIACGIFERVTGED